MIDYVKRKQPWSEIKLNWVRQYLLKNIQRKLSGNANTAATKTELFRPAPFSSLKNKAMLVYNYDVQKVKSWNKAGLTEMSCHIEAMRQKVESNGRTRFVLMVPPDKLTAYADFLSDKGIRNISALAKLSDYHPEVMPRLDLSLISAIHEGEQDIYLPDDTHWGSRGNQIAAETLLTFLREPKQP